MKNILVPVDLSAFSNEITEEAIKLAKAINAKLTLLHVVSLDIGFIIGDIGFQYLPELEKTALETDAKELDEIHKYVEKQGVESVALVKQGIPVDTIIEQTKELGIDIIVIGSKGHGTLYEALVGSVCRDVIKNSTVPVYVVPNQQRKK